MSRPPRNAGATEETKPTERRPECLVALQPRGSRAPLFFVHPIGGTIFCYAPLARSLGGDQPFYALFSRGLEEGDVPNVSIEAMAAEYLAEIRRVQPRGRYQIGGWSMGGLVALELAHRLVRAGAQVELLALVDAPAPLSEDLSGEELSIGLARDIEGMSGKKLGLTLDDLRKLPSPAREGHVLDRAFALEAFPPDLPRAELERLSRVLAANAHAMRTYRPAKYPGKATLMLAAKESVALESDWQRYVERLEVRRIPGDHYTMVTSPNVEVLAMELLRQTS